MSSDWVLFSRVGKSWSISLTSRSSLSLMYSSTSYSCASFLAIARYFSTEPLVRVSLSSPPQTSQRAETVGLRRVRLHALHLNDWVEYFFMFPIMSLIRWVLIIDSTTCLAETASIFSAT